MKAIFSVKLDRIWFWLWPRRVPTWPTSESHMSSSQPSPNSDSSASEPGLSAPLESIHPDSEILPKLFFIAFCLEGNVTVDVMRSAGTERDTDGWLCPSHLSSSSVSSSLTADFTCRWPACFNLYLQFGFDVFVLVDARVSIQLSRGVSFVNIQFVLVCFTFSVIIFLRGLWVWWTVSPSSSYTTGKKFAQGLLCLRNKLWLN